MPVLDPKKVTSSACGVGFGRLFWTFLFFCFDFNLGVNAFTVNVLADFIGWILVISALDEMESAHSEVKPLKRIAAIALLVSLLDLLGDYWAWHSVLGPLEGLAVVAAVVAKWALLLVFAWRLCGMIMDIACHLGREPLARHAGLCRKIGVVFALSMLGGILLAICQVAIVQVLPVPVFVFEVVWLVLMMRLMKLTQRACYESHP